MTTNFQNGKVYPAEKSKEVKTVNLSYNKLRGRIVELFGSQKEFSKRIGLSEQSITAKLNGRSDFSQDDILIWSNSLQIKLEEIGIYFFNQ